MSDTVKLLNNGERTIEVAQKVFFRPKEVLPLPANLAAKVKKLYPGEVVDLEDVTKQFAPQTEKVEEEKVAVIEPEPTEEEKAAAALKLEAEAAGLTVEELVTKRLEVADLVAGGMSKDEAEAKVFSKE